LQTAAAPAYSRQKLRREDYGVDWKHIRHAVAGGDRPLIGRRPRAREDDLVIEEVEDEVLVYDQRTHHAHALTATAADVWRACDGDTTAKGLGARLGLDARTTARALEELASCGLLDSTTQIDHGGNGLTRRQVTARAAKLGGAAAAAPLILSIAAPVAEAAPTPTIAQCAQYHDHACNPCATVCGCCCCCQAGPCKTCFPTNMCPSFNCPQGQRADCSVESKVDCVPAGTPVLCHPPNQTMFTPCCTP
jgi:hypothetical protein